MWNWTAKDVPDQSGKVVVITGANSGIGYESAVVLAGKGARVIMACRNPEKAERAYQTLRKAVPDAKVDILALDLGSLKSVRSFADTFNSRYDRLDILMNNAGIMIPPNSKTADGFESQFGTNHLGHFALTGRLLPKVLQTPKSRIVNVSSGMYLSGRIHFDDLQSEKHYSPMGAYAQSKLANILFTLELERKLEAVKADVISVASHPGYAITNLQKHQSGATQQLFDVLLKPVISQSAELGAIYQLYAATAPGVQGSEFYGPKFLLRGEVVRAGINARGRDAEVAAHLWKVSEQLTDVHYDALRQAVFA